MAVLAALDQRTAERLAGIFEVLSDPTRIRIVHTLLGGEQNVSDLATAAGISDSAASHQLRRLRDAHLVRTRRDGKQIFYALDDDHVARLFADGLEHALENR